MMPFPSNAMARGTTVGGGIGGGGGSQRQQMVRSQYVNTSSAADKQYALPDGTYVNEQGV
jgi:hypothetical protein